MLSKTMRRDEKKRRINFLGSEDEEESKRKDLEIQRSNINHHT